ncbi:MAG: type I restriction-modification system subunit M N-terminal domain-containing protein [Actinomycetota bacterium]
MTAPTVQIVPKLWSCCNVLLDAGLTYLDYTEQLTYLLFLKMAHQRTLDPWNRLSPVPAEYAWPTLATHWTGLAIPAAQPTLDEQ